MSPNEFAYWLQGYFELSNFSTGGKLTLSQVEIVQRHIALVRTLHPNDVLCLKVEVALQVANELDRAALVQKLLADQFEHVIDPQHPDPKAADAAHAGDFDAELKAMQEALKPISDKMQKVVNDIFSSTRPPNVYRC